MGLKYRSTSDVMSSCGRRGSPTGSRRLTGRHREGPLSLQAKTLVRSPLVVFSSPVLDDHAFLGQRPELLPVETLGPEPGMKALDEPVLPRASRVYVESLDELSVHLLGSEFEDWPVMQVRGNTAGLLCVSQQTTLEFR